jgi:hypothetical protein
MDPVRNILEELKADPHRFQRTDGYRRLLELLQARHSPLAIKELLRGDDTFVGDILWTVCELDDLEPYVEEASHHIDAQDPGTAAYAIEVLLRAAHKSDLLKVALGRLESAPLPVREHAILVLAAQGMTRAGDVFRLGNWTWAAALMDGLLDRSHDPETTLKSLVDDSRQDRVLVGLVVATIASETDERAVRILDQSEQEWVRDFAVQLRRMFQHRWRASARPDK